MLALGRRTTPAECSERPAMARNEPPCPDLSSLQLMCEVFGVVHARLSQMRPRAAIPSRNRDDCSDISQIPKPLLHRCPFGPIHLGRVSADQLFQHEQQEFLDVAERFAKLPLGSSTQIGGKPDFARFAHGPGLIFQKTLVLV